MLIKIARLVTYSAFNIKFCLCNTELCLTWFYLTSFLDSFVLVKENDGPKKSNSVLIVLQIVSKI